MHVQEKIFTKSPLREEDLSELDLRGWDLSNNIELRGAVLSKLKGIFITDVLLEGANLEEAKVTKEQAEYLTAQGLSGFVIVE